MKKSILLGLLVLYAASAGAQSPASNEQKQIDDAIKQLQTQQARIADNQMKIDAKLVALAEAIRVAKIYASRGGR